MSYYQDTFLNGRSPENLWEICMMFLFMIVTLSVSMFLFVGFVLGLEQVLKWCYPERYQSDDEEAVSAHDKLK